MDLHVHSNVSDGTDTPAELVNKAADAGIGMLAISDHDAIGGVEDARKTANEKDIILIPSVEMSCKYEEELHILGLDIDPDSAPIREMLEEVNFKRKDRNRKMLRKLEDAGYRIGPFMENPAVLTRAHFATALVEAGYADNVSDAFRKFVGDNAPYYIKRELLPPKEVIDTILAGGGLPVLAHPCLMRGNTDLLIHELTDMGLLGIEAYYSKSTEGQTQHYRNIARQNHLFVTCGSDYHGTRKPDITLGQGWEPADDLKACREMLFERCK